MIPEILNLMSLFIIAQMHLQTSTFWMAICHLLLELGGSHPIVMLCMSCICAYHMQHRYVHLPF